MQLHQSHVCAFCCTILHNLPSSVLLIHKCWELLAMISSKLGLQILSSSFSFFFLFFHPQRRRILSIRRCDCPDRCIRSCRPGRSEWVRFAEVWILTNGIHTHTYTQLTASPSCLLNLVQLGDASGLVSSSIHRHGLGTRTHVDERSCVQDLDFVEHTAVAIAFSLTAGLYTEITHMMDTGGVWRFLPEPWIVCVAGHEDEWQSEQPVWTCKFMATCSQQSGRETRPAPHTANSFIRVFVRSCPWISC